MLFDSPFVDITVSRKLESIEVAGQVFLVGAMITRDEPLTRLHFWYHSVLVDPVTAVAGLSPNGRVILLPLFWKSGSGGSLNISSPSCLSM